MKSKRAKLVIHDKSMHPVALKLLLQSGEYETETQEWLKLPDNQQTCTECKAAFMEAYVVKRRAEADQEGEGNPFGGSAVISSSAEKKRNGQLWRQGHTASERPAPLTNQMMDLLEGYLEKYLRRQHKLLQKEGHLRS